MDCNHGDIALTLLEYWNVAVLKRDNAMVYSLIGKPPQFYQKLFGEESGELSSQPWLQSSMLEFFIVDAEAFFEEGKEGEIHSGSWREDGVDGDTALEARAVHYQGNSLLIIRSLEEDYIERNKLLQKAREHLLNQRAMNSDLANYKKKATYDALTGLYNRGTLMEAMRDHLRNSANTGVPFSLLILDIDNFKRVNDTYGHLAGDKVLSSIGKLLQQSLRQTDVAARYGGEELMVLAPDTAQQNAFLMADNLRKRIAEYDFDLPQQITVSIGCTEYAPHDSPETIIARADLALYEAKRLTKNMVVIR